MKTKYLILGAGPAGLSFANRIMQLGENDFVVLEKDKSNASNLYAAKNPVFPYFFPKAKMISGKTYKI